MKSVGQVIKEARVKKGYSRIDLGELTHIRTAFISAIENSDWESLPEFNITLGFVKAISHFLDIDERQVVSVFRRDYPPKLIQGIDGKVKKEVFGRKFMWGPRMTFAAGVVGIILVVVIYLGFQYRKFSLPPSLNIEEPTEGQVVRVNTLRVVGKTDSDARVEINNQPTVTEEGKFDTQIEISESTREVKIVAKSRSGKETVVSRTIKPEL